MHPRGRGGEYMFCLVELDIHEYPYLSLCWVTIYGSLDICIQQWRLNLHLSLKSYCLSTNYRDLY